MLEERVNRLPVVDVDGKLVGLVSRGDLVRAFARTDAEIQREIEEDVLRRVMWLDPSDVSVTVERRRRHAQRPGRDSRPTPTSCQGSRAGCRESSRSQSSLDGARLDASRLLRRRGVHVRRDVGDLLCAQLALERRHRAHSRS